MIENSYFLLQNRKKRAELVKRSNKKRSPKKNESVKFEIATTITNFRENKNILKIYRLLSQ